MCKNIVNKIKESYPELIVTVLAPALLALSSVLTVFSDFNISEVCQHKAPIIIFIIGLFLQIFFFVVSYRRRLSNSELTTDNERLAQEVRRLENEISDYGYNNHEVFNRLSNIIFSYFDFSADERISIYKINNEYNCFNILGRYSASYAHGKLGRKQYPIDQGFIGKVISSGNGVFFTDNQLPSFVNGNKQEYYNYLDQHSVKYDREALKTMSMVSRAYYCKTIYDQSNKPIAVVVVESKNIGVLTPKRGVIDEILDRYSSIISTLSEKAKIIIPDKEFAKNKGF